jgi:hypothetical protein
MEDNRIENDKYLDFDVKIPIDELKNNLDIYFYNTSDVINQRYIRSNNELAINVKWYYAKFHSSVYEEGMHDFMNEISESVTDVFWYKANQIAIHYGYAACYASGRSNGWAMPMLKNGNNNDVKSLVYQSDNKDMEYLIKLKIFSMFANDIESLFRLIDKQVCHIENKLQLNELINKIQDI